MYFSSQLDYERYHSPEARAQRESAARMARETTVSQAQAAFDDGDVETARQILFDGGISHDGICDYFTLWRD